MTLGLCSRDAFDRLQKGKRIAPPHEGFDPRPRPLSLER